MPFQPGQSGNPAGRPRGSRNKKSLAAEAALFAHAPQLVDELVTRAMRGEPEAMRLCMERILPAGGGRPVPIELPPVRSGEDAYAAAAVIMQALKQGVVSAREAVDLLRVVKALARLVGAVADIKRAERREMARAAEHFAGPPAASDDALRAREMNAQHAPADEADDGDEIRVRSNQDAPLRDELPSGPANGAWREHVLPMDGVQIGADSVVQPRGG